MIPNFVKLKLPLDQKQIDTFNVTLIQLRDLLTRKLSLAENTTALIVEIPFQAPNAPSFPLSEKPLGVLPLAFESVGANNGGSVAMAAPFQWSWSEGTVSVPSLAALSGSLMYNLRVLVVRG